MKENCRERVAKKGSQEFGRRKRREKRNFSSWLSHLGKQSFTVCVSRFPPISKYSFTFTTSSCNGHLRCFAASHSSLARHINLRYITCHWKNEYEIEERNNIAIIASSCSSVASNTRATIVFHRIHFYSRNVSKITTRTNTSATFPSLGVLATIRNSSPLASLHSRSLSVQISARSRSLNPTNSNIVRHTDTHTHTHVAPTTS